MESVQAKRQGIKRNTTEFIEPTFNQTAATATNLSSSIPYTEIMLCEYSLLVNALAKLDNFQLKDLQEEVDKALNDLSHWLDESGTTTDTIQLFSALRRLKQKANVIAQQASTKSSIAANKAYQQTKDSAHHINHKQPAAANN